MSNPKYEECNVKGDCFGYYNQIKGAPPKCLALDGLYCATGHCNFYKPKEVQEALLKKYGGPNDTYSKSTK